MNIFAFILLLLLLLLEVNLTDGLNNQTSNNTCPSSYVPGCLFQGPLIRAYGGLVYTNQPGVQNVPSDLVSTGEGVSLPKDGLNETFLAATMVGSTTSTTALCVNLTLHMFSATFTQLNSDQAINGLVAVVQTQACSNCAALNVRSVNCLALQQDARLILANTVLHLRCDPPPAGYRVQLFKFEKSTKSWVPEARASIESDHDRCSISAALGLGSFVAVNIPLQTTPIPTTTPRPPLFHCTPEEKAQCGCGDNVTSSLLRIGMRVARGPSWQWGDQDGFSLGTVICNRQFYHGWYQVQWDSPAKVQAPTCNLDGSACSDICRCTTGFNYYRYTGDTHDLVVASCDLNQNARTCEFFRAQDYLGPDDLLWGQCISTLAAGARVQVKPYTGVGASIVKEALIVLLLGRSWFVNRDWEWRVRSIAAVRMLLRAIGGMAVVAMVTVWVVASHWGSKWEAFNVWVFFVVHSSGVICTAQYFASALTETSWTR